MGGLLGKKVSTPLGLILVLIFVLILGNFVFREFKNFMDERIDVVELGE